MNKGRDGVKRRETSSFSRFAECKLSLSHQTARSLYFHLYSYREMPSGCTLWNMEEQLCVNLFTILPHKCSFGAANCSALEAKV